MNNDKKLNKILIFLGVVLAILVLFYVSENIGDRSNDKSLSNVKPQENISEEESNSNENSGDENPLITEKWDSKEQKKVEKINYSKFKERLAKDEVSVIMLSTDTCYWCMNQKPVLEHFVYLNPDINVKVLDLSYLTQEDYQHLSSLDKELERIGTPTFLSIRKGKVEKIESGAKNLEGLETMFKKMGAM